MLFYSLKENIKKITPGFIIRTYHYLLALIGAFAYGFPSGRICVIGVTGTTGKSTVVAFITKVLEESGAKVASLSSVNFQIGREKWENRLKMTMPGRFQIQKFLKRAADSNCSYCVLEVTSEGIKQYRHKFISFDTAVFTNLSPEHIESHKGFENYREAKSKLFKQAKKVHVINLDDDNVPYFLKERAERKYGYTLNNKEAEGLSAVQGSLVSETRKGISFKVQDIIFKLDLLGRFNAYNALASIATGLSQGISLEQCQRALEKIKKISGRMEIVTKDPFSVVVDYAHTPAALEKVYKSLKRVGKGSKMVCVLGSCGGGRDKWKRPVMGEIASRYCDDIILTNEDPYDEDPWKIMSSVKEGIPPEKNVQEILDRREAIKKSLELATPESIVVITGKGSEPWMCVAGGQKIPWDDREIVKEEFEKIRG